MGARLACTSVALALGIAAYGSSSDARPANPPPAGFPALDVTVVADDLDHPWDVVTGPDGTILTGERAGRFVAVRPDGTRVDVRADLGDLFASSETGLMALALATDFETSRTVYSCQGYQGQDGKDVRVVTWQANDDWTELTRTGTLIDGFPIYSGRHGGCRILPMPDQTIYIAVGDAAQPTIPQDPDSLGGKVLRVAASTGEPFGDNPFPASAVYTLGHRNVQGLARRPDTGQIYAVEQGSSRDDEVNLLTPGGNYGWKPDREPGKYDESVPMTDPDRVPGAIPAVWSSGPTTIATASGTFLTGARWGEWEGALAVAALKGRQVILLRLTDDGSRVVDEVTPVELNATFGRLRTVAAQPDGSLLVTTDNGGDDKILRVTPA